MEQVERREERLSRSEQARELVDAARGVLDTCVLTRNDAKDSFELYLRRHPTHRPQRDPAAMPLYSPAPEPGASLDSSGRQACPFALPAVPLAMSDRVRCGSTEPGFPSPGSASLDSERR